MFSIAVRTAVLAEGQHTFDIRRRILLATARFTNGEFVPDALLAAQRGRLCNEDQPPELSYKNADLEALWNTYERQIRPYFGPTPPQDVLQRFSALLRKIAPA